MVLHRIIAERYCTELLQKGIAQSYCTERLHKVIAQDHCARLLNSFIAEIFFVLSSPNIFSICCLSDAAKSKW